LFSTFAVARQIPGFLGGGAASLPQLLRVRSSPVLLDRADFPPAGVFFFELSFSTTRPLGAAPACFFVFGKLAVFLFYGDLFFFSFRTLSFPLFLPGSPIFLSLVRFVSFFPSGVSFSIPVSSSRFSIHSATFFFPPSARPFLGFFFFSVQLKRRGLSPVFYCPPLFSHSNGSVPRRRFACEL